MFLQCSRANSANKNRGFVKQRIAFVAAKLIVTHFAGKLGKIASKFSPNCAFLRPQPYLLENLFIRNFNHKHFVYFTLNSQLAQRFHLKTLKNP